MLIYQETKAVCITGLLIIPGLISIICVVNLILSMRRIVLSKQRNQHILWPYIVSVVTSLIILFISAHQLKRGVFLPFEEQTETMTGSISSVMRDQLSPRYSLGQKESVSYASVICINEKKYYCLFSDDIQVNDCVTIDYLPQSGVVLKFFVESKAGGRYN